MNIREKVKTMVRVLKISEKPDRESFMLSLKVFLIGLLIIGGLAFVIHLIASFLGSTIARPPSSAG
jgi:protein translocase SEC61 complex gamma subunit